MKTLITTIQYSKQAKRLLSLALAAPTKFSEEPDCSVIQLVNFLHINFI